MNRLIPTLCVAVFATGQTNELARTPPMGWNSWEPFHLQITDAMIRAQAKALVNSGMKDAGYEYVVIDGGWEGFHDANGVFHPNAFKFRDMKALCDYIHGLGLKVGIHTTPGPMTCLGREGSYGHEKQDAATFASWGIDFLKYDWCSGSLVYSPGEMRSVYEKMHQAILRTGRPMMYSLSQYGMEAVWKWGPSVGAQMWRTTEDVADDWLHMSDNGFKQNGLEQYAGPGHWNDPDMLDIGNGGMDEEEYRTEMSLWSILAAPLFASNDLTKMTRQALDLLTNREVIAVDQDPAGVQGRRISEEGPLEIWMKPLADGSKAVGLFNRDDYPMSMTLRAEALEFTGKARLRDLWTHRDLPPLGNGFTAVVPRHGVVLLRVQP